jgi:hypothetical protein
MDNRQQQLQQYDWELKRIRGFGRHPMALPVNVKLDELPTERSTPFSQLVCAHLRRYSSAARCPFLFSVDCRFLRR